MVRSTKRKEQGLAITQSYIIAAIHLSYNYYRLDIGIISIIMYDIIIIIIYST